VVVTVQSEAPSYFMRYWGRTGTTVAASSRATRRDSVIMMVLDRSGSMAGTPCTDMKAAAKQFTGMFSAERDRIGMITFNMGSFISSAPTTNFKTVLGYNDGMNSATGAIDSIGCTGGTGTPQATILGYNELYKVGLPGALNVLLLFTDGEPTAMTLDIRGGSTGPRGILKDAVTCQDSAGRSIATTASPMGSLSNNPPNWTAGWSLGSGSWLSNVGSGPIAALYGDTSQNLWLFDYRGTATTGADPLLSPSGCPGNQSGSGDTVYNNTVRWLPNSDVYGNNLTGYNSLAYQTYDGVSRINSTRTNFRNAAFNASANAADRARTSRNLPDGRNFPGVYVYAIGLGAVNHQFLQRMANDPDADPGGAYGAFTGHNTSQPIGNYVYASDSTRLSAAFAQIASFILRLSQ
jgi:hypothetical protein